MKKTIGSALFLAIFSCACVMTGCRLGDDTMRINNELLGIVEENTTALCSDGIDNDGDTLVDCQDAGCLMTTNPDSPGNTVCPNENGVLKENNEYTCSDGIDNDGNGFSDCSDNYCKQSAYCCPSPGPETSFEACSDGIDNDCNGYIDCSDHACSRSSDPEIVQYCKEVNCPDGVSDETSLEACSDGIDNDCNGYVDCGDFSCSRSTNADILAFCGRSLDPVDENSEALCSDGIDNNFNGIADCDETSCQSFSYCQNLTPEIAVRSLDFKTMNSAARAQILAQEKALCTDGIDNDHNGIIDCNEYQCQLRQQEVLTGSEAQYMFNCPSENDAQSCVDGIDNDYNGLVDCKDPNCRLLDICKSGTDRKLHPAFEMSEDSEKTCADGVDNDQNGLADCKDPGCMDTEHCSDIEAEPALRPANFETLSAKRRAEILAREKEVCTDGIDNDKDGLKDCKVEACVRRSHEILSGDEAQYMFDYRIPSLDGKSYTFGCR